MTRLLQSAVWAEVQNRFDWYPLTLDGIPGEEVVQGLARQLGPLTWMVYVPHAPGRGTGRDLLDSLLRLSDAGYDLSTQLSRRGRWTTVVRFDLDWPLPRDGEALTLRTTLRRTLNPLLAPGSTIAPVSIQPDRYLVLDLHRGRDALIRRLSSGALQVLQPLRRPPFPVRREGAVAVSGFFRNLAVRPSGNSGPTPAGREERVWWAALAESLPRFGAACSVYTEPESGSQLLAVEYGESTDVVDAHVASGADYSSLVRLILGTALDRMQHGRTSLTLMRLRPYLGSKSRWAPDRHLAADLGLREVRVLGTYDCILGPARYQLWAMAERARNRRKR